MFGQNLSLTRFKSGLTYDEADALVESYLSTIQDKDAKIAVLASFLKTSVRDSKHTRDVISQLVGERKRA
jgi:hypothetical protein